MPAAGARLAAPSLRPLTGWEMGQIPGDSLPRSPIWAPSGLTDMLGAFPDKIHKGFPSAHGVIFAWGRVLQWQPLEVSGAAPHAKPQEEASPADTSSCPMPHPLQHLVKPQIRALGGQKACCWHRAGTERWERGQEKLEKGTLRFLLPFTSSSQLLDTSRAQGLRPPLAAGSGLEASRASSSCPGCSPLGS